MIKKSVRKIKVLLLCPVLVLMLLSACGSSSQTSGQASADGEETADSESLTISIAYQEGLSYAAVIIARDQQLIEQYYYEATGNELTIEWNIMNSGADINTGFASGSLDVGFLGVAPAVTGIVNNVGYRIFSGISGQEYGLTTNDPDIETVGDFVGTDSQIAVTSLNSLPHIILAMALENAGYDPHALDENLIGMTHSDSVASLQSGGLAGHMSTNPYLYMERENEDLHEVEGISDVWTTENSLVVGVASEALYEQYPELYEALCNAISDATDLVNSDVEAAAAITCDYNGNTLEDEISYIEAGNYTITTSGVYALAAFMAEAEYVDEAPESYEAMVFDNVTGD